MGDHTKLCPMVLLCIHQLFSVLRSFNIQGWLLSLLELKALQIDLRVMIICPTLFLLKAIELEELDERFGPEHCSGVSSLVF